MKPGPRLEVDPSEGLLIEWPDGHQSRYPLPLLREICPCAACRGGTRDQHSLPIAGTARPVRITPIGNYAIGIKWGDGHDSGIYSWEYLRRRCGCLACRFARQTEDR
jgi:DUF971 family protein